MCLRGAKGRGETEWEPHGEEDGDEEGVREQASVRLLWDLCRTHRDLQDVQEKGLKHGQDLGQDQQVSVLPVDFMNV